MSASAGALPATRMSTAPVHSGPAVSPKDLEMQAQLTVVNGDVSKTEQAAERAFLELACGAFVEIVACQKR